MTLAGPWTPDCIGHVVAIADIIASGIKPLGLFIRAEFKFGYGRTYEVSTMGPRKVRD